MTNAKKMLMSDLDLIAEMAAIAKDEIERGQLGTAWCTVDEIIDQGSKVLGSLDTLLNETEGQRDT